ncbi:transcriptional regulator [Oceanobacillus caeni]|uniref:hypothetical protein n=1 Tax=Oceanobacillus TaxID=182709 RepID=UPI0006223E32|nr:hypothetical protein [Oceanobacillus caeni]KKE78152.1 transcriptional regulator [Bacilli bacterium VT-13-104]PZD84782.1 transcriptional regulator [Bacilli bacterium]MCR1835050.1 transcriptional regulator [Oceanobacillus caeni]PZD86199.1 transcriptional regulator [Bacilli bacterium]PZD89315.1 transcriptional regulator [Bacilli bacterium]
MSEGISYQNKDILFKFLSELYENVTLDVFGLDDIPKIKELLPNEFPEVTADEKRADTVFQLEDGSILMLEYESNSRFVENHLKYVRYVHRISQRYLQKENDIKKVRIVVIYTSDVVKVKEKLDLGDLQIASKSVLLSEYNGDAIMEKIVNKIRVGEQLTHEELFKFSILPLMHSVRERDELIHDSIELAKKIDNEQQQVQVIAGILTSTDKFIDDEYARKVKEWLKMTKVGRAFEEEKQEAVKKAEKEAEKKQAKRIAKSLLGVLNDKLIAEATGLDIEEVKKLREV